MIMYFDDPSRETDTYIYVYMYITEFGHTWKRKSFEVDLTKGMIVYPHIDNAIRRKCETSFDDANVSQEERRLSFMEFILQYNRIPLVTILYFDRLDRLDIYIYIYIVTTKAVVLASMLS
jgi:hypothetical protein